MSVYNVYHTLDQIDNQQGQSESLANDIEVLGTNNLKQRKAKLDQKFDSITWRHLHIHKSLPSFLTKILKKSILLKNATKYIKHLNLFYRFLHKLIKCYCTDLHELCQHDDNFDCSYVGCNYSTTLCQMLMIMTMTKKI